MFTPTTIETLEYPKRVSEFEIQSELFERLKQSGKNVRGEVKGYKSRLDLVLYCGSNTAISVIEVKSRKRPRKHVKIYKQTSRYFSTFFLPILLCTSMQEIEIVFSQVDFICKHVMNIGSEEFLSKWRKGEITIPQSPSKSVAF